MAFAGNARRRRLCAAAKSGRAGDTQPVATRANAERPRGPVVDAADVRMRCAARDGAQPSGEAAGTQLTAVADNGPSSGPRRN